MESSIDKKINQNIEQQNVEKYGEKISPRSSNASSYNGDQLDRINKELSKPYRASHKAVLWGKHQELTGISFEDTQALLQQLQRFQETIGGDWRSVISQWQNLQNCWQDRQYDRFEPFFEQLCRTYDQCGQQCEEYIQFLEERVRTAEDATAALNI